MSGRKAPKRKNSSKGKTANKKEPVPILQKEDVVVLTSDEEAEEYDVEKIVGHRSSVVNGLEYLIKWLGYDEEHNTWEAQQNLNCKDKVDEYWKTKKREAPTQGGQAGRASVSEISSPVPSSNRVSSNRSKAGKSRLSSPPRKTRPPLSLKDWEHELNEISKAAKEARLFVENLVDDERAPADFTFITASIPMGNASGIDLKAVTLSCECRPGQCGKSDDCCPQNNEGAVAYRQFDGRLLTKHKGAIYECNSGCKCGPKCFNRVVQLGRQIELCIYRTPHSGWGVRAIKPIPANTFVTEYVGEIITTKESQGRKSKYLFEMDYDGESVYTVDAEKMGNVAHFINHSCDPNIVVRNVYVDCIDAKIPRLAFFSVREIAAGEQICFDYAPTNNPNVANRQQQQADDDSDDDEEDEMNQKCYCGAKKCRGELIF